MFNIGGANIQITADDNQARGAFARISRSLKTVETLIRKVGGSQDVIKQTGQSLGTMASHARNMEQGVGKAYRSTTGHLKSMGDASKNLGSDLEQTANKASSAYGSVSSDAASMEAQATKSYRAVGSAASDMADEAHTSHGVINRETRQTQRYMQGLSAEAQRMQREMSEHSRQSKLGSVQLREDAIKNKYAYHQLAKSSAEYMGTNEEFMNDILKLGKEDKRIKDEMMKNNDHMKSSFFKTVGAMMARSSQASKISDNFKKAGGIMNTVNRPLLAIADKMDRISRMGTPAALALKQLGPTANMKALNERMMLITQGIMRFQSVALVATVAAGLFYSALHKGAKKASAEYAGAWKDMVSTVSSLFEPLIQVFAKIMTPIYKAITFVARLVKNFQEANPVLTKLIAAFVVLVPLLTALLSPLAVGIGLWGGIQAAMGALGPIMGPLVTGFASILGTVALVATGLVALGAAFILLYKKSSEFRAFVDVLKKALVTAFQTIYNYVDKAIKRIKQVAMAVSEWEGFIPVVLGLVTAITSYYTILGLLWTRKKLIIAVTKAYQTIQKIGIALTAANTAANIAFTKAGGGLKGVLAALRAAQLKLNIAMVANPIGLVIALVAGLVVGLVVAYKRSETFRNIVNKAFASIKQVAMTVFNWFKNELPKLAARFKKWADDSYNSTVGAMRNMKDKLVSFFRNMISGANDLYKGMTASIRNLRDKVVGFFRSMISSANNMYNKTIQAMRNFKTGIINAFKAAWDTVKRVSFNATKWIVQKIVDAVKMYIYIFKNWRPLLKKTFELAMKVITNAVLKLVKYISQKFNDIVKFGKELPGRIARAFRSTAALVRKAFADLANYLSKKISENFNKFVRWFKELPGRASRAFRAAAGAVRKAFSDLWSYLSKRFTETLNKFVKWFKELPGRISRAFRSTYSTIKNAFLYISKYMLDRIRNTLNSLVKWFKELPGRVSRVFRAGFGIIKNAFLTIAKYILDKIRNTFSSLVRWASDLPGRMGSAIRRAGSKALSAVSSLATNIKNKMRDAYNSMVDGAKKLPGRIGTGIRSLAGKALAGVKSMGNSLLGGMGKAVNGLVGGINTILSKLDIKDRIPKWKVPKYAQGTPGHPGGPAILGDGGGRELFKTPQGLVGLSPATDTLYDLPKGTSVLSAPKTRKFLGKVPKYAKGVGDFFSDSYSWAKDKFGKAKSKASDIKDFFKENVKDIWDYASNPSKLVNLMVEKLALKVASGKGVAKIAGGGMNFLIKKTRGFIKSKFDMFGGEGGDGVNVFKGLTKTQGFGKAGGSNGYFHHDGVDYAGPLGSFIKSVTSGKVSFAGKAFQGYGGGFGNLVKVASGAYEHFYGHLQKVIATKGQPVTAGQTLLGTLGSTGNSTGPHVHYEVRKNGTPVDPMPFLTGKKQGGSVRSWIKKAMAIAGVKGDNWANGLYTVAMGESTGDPNKVNNWDSNARAGIPSKGLMQMIPPTFSAHMKKGYGNIFNPIDNIIASIDYIQDRYKGISNVPGVIARRLGRPYVGYETGGFINQQQVAMLGEGGKREVVIPLENRRYMKPFSDAVAANLKGTGGTQFNQENHFHGNGYQSPHQITRALEKQSKKFAEKL